jgi:malic enzyme
LLTFNDDIQGTAAVALVQNQATFLGMTRRASC